MSFTKEQQEQIDFIKSKSKNKDLKGEALNNSAAGSGKTFVAKHLQSLFKRNIQFIAPTHKACSILGRDVKNVQTIHKFLNAKGNYDKLGNLIFKFDTKNKKLSNYIIVIDECSMVSEEMYKVISELKENNLIIYLGDDLQLPPINSEDSDNKSDNILSKKSPTFNIKKVFKFNKNMRSQELVSTLMLEKAREAIHNGHMPPQLISKKIEDIIQDFKDKKDVVILAYTNVAVNNYNKYIRSALFNEDKENLKPYYIDENLIFSGYRTTDFITYHSSDKITIKKLKIVKLNLKIQRCDCKDDEYNQTLCKKHKFRKNDIELEFYEIIDQFNTIWYKPLNQKQFYILSWQFKEMAKLKKDSYYWKTYYEFMTLYNGDLKYEYCSTIHKSQGSQWDIVYVDRQNLIGCTSRDKLLRLNAYYTAISRMKESVYDIAHI